MTRDLDILPDLHVTPTVTQVFMFSAATWNRHHIHFSRDAALSEGHPQVAIQRALLGSLMARQVTTWLGDKGFIRRISWKVVRSAYPGAPLTCTGVISNGLPELNSEITCELQIVDSLRAVIATGTAVVSWTPPNDQGRFR